MEGVLDRTVMEGSWIGQKDGVLDRTGREGVLDRTGMKGVLDMTGMEGVKERTGMEGSWIEQ